MWNIIYGQLAAKAEEQNCQMYRFVEQVRNNLFDRLKLAVCSFIGRRNLNVGETPS